MLSSEQSGEVFNAARAIGRALRSIGADWHDLVAGLFAPTTKGKTPHEPHNGDSTKSANWRAMRSFCLQHPERLSRREKEFIDSLGRWRGKLTEKQHAWLEAINERLRHRHAA